MSHCSLQSIIIKPFLHFYIQSLNHSVNAFLLSAHYVARTLLGVGNLKVSKTDMVSSPISFGLEWGAQLFISGGLRDIIAN